MPTRRSDEHHVQSKLARDESISELRVVTGFTALEPVSRHPPIMTVEGTMLEFDSYREVLLEHARGRHLVESAWFIVIAIAVFIIASS